MERSTIAIGAAIECGVPTPAVVETLEVDGRPGQVMERVDGPDQFSVVGARPWTLVAMAHTLGRVHAELHRTVVPDGYPTLHEHVRDHLARTDLVPAEIAAAAGDALEALPNGTAMCHGDYHPGNVLMTADGPVVIDWTNAVRGDPMADVARTRLMLGLGELPPGSPPLVRVAAAAGRGVFGHLYLRAYRRAGHLDSALVDRWEPVRAADRLGEGIEGERDALLEVCRRGFG